MRKHVLSSLVALLYVVTIIGVADAVFFANTITGTVRGGPSKRLNAPIGQYVSAKPLFQAGNSAVFVTISGKGLSDEFTINDNVLNQGIIQHNAGISCVYGSPSHASVPDNPVDTGVWISNTTTEFMFNGMGHCTIGDGPTPGLVVLFTLWP